MTSTKSPNNNSKMLRLSSGNQLHPSCFLTFYRENDDERLPDGYNPDEAYVDDDIDADNVDVSASEGSGDDLDDHVDKDYEARPELDRYDESGIDDNEQQMIDAEARRLAERQNDMLRRVKDRG